MKEVKLSYGLLADPLTTQLRGLGFKHNVKRVEVFQRQLSSILELRMSLLLTDSMMDKILSKLHKRIVDHISDEKKI